MSTEVRNKENDETNNEIFNYNGKIGQTHKNIHPQLNKFL